MSPTSSAENERSLLLGEKAFDLIKSHVSPAYPRAYEVWYHYAGGHKPQLNEAVKRLTLDNGTISGQDIDQIYNTFFSNDRLQTETEKASHHVLSEIDNVMSMVNQALGSTQEYNQSLEGLSKDLSNTDERARIREIVQSLVVATKNMESTNSILETRLRETRSEIETLRETLEIVRIESLTDPLTGIANRKHFEEMLIKAIDHSAVQKTPFCLIMIDIDHFKNFNDTYGHLTGDQVIKLVTMTMREHVKTKATLARFGGEEFAIVLPETDLEQARQIGERIRKSVMSREIVKRSTGESLGKVTISVGVGTYRRGDTSISLLDRADQCLYQAKRSGRNRTIGDDEMDTNWPDVA